MASYRVFISELFLDGKQLRTHLPIAELNRHSDRDCFRPLQWCAVGWNANKLGVTVFRQTVGFSLRLLMAPPRGKGIDVREWTVASISVYSFLSLQQEEEEAPEEHFVDRCSLLDVLLGCRVSSAGCWWLNERIQNRFLDSSRLLSPANRYLQTVVCLLLSSKQLPMCHCRWTTMTFLLQLKRDQHQTQSTVMLIALVDTEAFSSVRPESLNIRLEWRRQKKSTQAYTSFYF